MAYARPQLAVNTEAEAVPARAEVRSVPIPFPKGSERPEQKDHFIVRNGLCYAGSHLIVDMWEAENLDDIEAIEQALTKAIEAACATLLHLHLHRFAPTGVSGVAVLAESHISIHTWPEKGYAALDIFMCGDAEPSKAIPVLREAFRPGSINVSEHKRGII